VAIRKCFKSDQLKQSKDIIFIYANFNSFVRTDFDILSSFQEVKLLQFKPVKGLLRTGVEMLKQFIALTIHIWKAEIVFVWFADFHSFLPVVFAKVLRKKSYVVIGGYEVCRINELNYGALCSKFRGFFCIKSMQLCTLNLTVSKYIDRKVKYIAPGSKREIVPNCVDFPKSSSMRLEKENLILTVGIIENERTFFLKGIDTFIEVAILLPEYQFLIIGIDKFKLSHLLVRIPENVVVLPRLAHDLLPVYYEKAKFYCQLSRSESFGVSIAESMFYGCIPIVTNEGGMPELIGNTGHIVPRKPFEICELIRKCSLNNPDYRSKGSNRIVNNFSRDKRKDLLIELLSTN